MPTLTSNVATTPEESFISDQHRAINPEAVLHTLLARTEGIVGVMHSAAISDAPLETTHVALTCEQIQANVRMVADIIDELMVSVDFADGMLGVDLAN